MGVILSLAELRLFFTGSGVLDAWPLSRTIQDTMSIPQTHDRAILKVGPSLHLKLKR